MVTVHCTMFSYISEPLHMSLPVSSTAIFPDKHLTNEKKNALDVAALGTKQK